MKTEKEYNYYDETENTEQKRYDKEVFKSSMKCLFKVLGLLLAIGVISYIVDCIRQIGRFKVL